jgi:iron complex transport system ATP-binding protein
MVCKDQQLYSGIVEDVLLQHDELTNASYFKSMKILFRLISLPPVSQRNAVFFASKKLPKDLSSLHFEFQNGFG